MNDRFCNSPVVSVAGPEPGDADVTAGPVTLCLSPDAAPLAFIAPGRQADGYSVAELAAIRDGITALLRELPTS